MKCRFTIIGLLSLFPPFVTAQVASHAPTVFQNPPVSASGAAQPVVRVNGAVLTEADLAREEYTIFPYARQHGGLPKDLAPQIREGALKMIVFEELVYQEALRRKMTVPATKLQRAEIDFRKQFATPEEFRAIFKDEFHSSKAQLEEKIRRSLLIDAFLRSEVEARSAVTPAEVRAFYDKNPARFAHPETYTFQTISILPPPHATADQLKEGRTRAESALKQAKVVKTSEGFGLLAEKLSDDDYRVVMGQHKPVPVDQLPPQVVKTLASMKPGDVSGVIQLDQAYTILHFQQHIQAGKTKFEDVSAQLTKELKQRKREQIRSALDAKLREKAKIETM